VLAWWRGRWFAASAHSSSQPTPRGRHGKESEKSEEDCQGDQESRQEDQEDEEVSARFSASQSRRGIATTIAGELDVSGRKRGDDQTGPMCTRLKKPTTDAHGSGFSSPVVSWVVRRTGFSGLRLSALRPSLRLRGGVGGASSVHALTIATGCFAPQAVDQKRPLGWDQMSRRLWSYGLRLARERRGGGRAEEMSCLRRYRRPARKFGGPTLQGEALQFGIIS